jgi:Flp pilus assembly protein TadG
MSTLHRRHGRGQSLVEFGLILPIFLLFIFGIIDLGRAVYAYHTLNSAAREAARVAVVDQTITHIQDEAIAQAMGLGLEAADITLDWRHANQPNVANSCASLLGEAEVASCTVTVRVEYEFRAATPIIGDIVGELAMAGLSSMIVEFNCQEPLPADSPLSACPAEE